MSDPVQILGELHDATERLDAASKELFRLQQAFDEVKANFDDAFNDYLATLIDKYEDEGKRLPGEEARHSLVVKQMRNEEPLLFGQHRRLRDELARKHALAKSIERAISSYQSQLSYLKTEAMAIQ